MRENTRNFPTGKFALLSRKVSCKFAHAILYEVHGFERLISVVQAYRKYFFRNLNERTHQEIPTPFEKPVQEIFLE